MLRLVYRERAEYYCRAVVAAACGRGYFLYILHSEVQLCLVVGFAVHPVTGAVAPTVPPAGMSITPTHPIASTADLPATVRVAAIAPPASTSTATMTTVASIVALLATVQAVHTAPTATTNIRASTLQSVQR